MGGDSRLFLSTKGVEVTLSPAFAMDDRLRSSLSSSGFKNSDIELGVGVAELEARPFTDLDAGLGGQAGSGACVRDSAMRRLLVRGQLGVFVVGHTTTPTAEELWMERPRYSNCYCC